MLGKTGDKRILIFEESFLKVWKRILLLRQIILLAQVLTSRSQHPAEARPGWVSSAGLKTNSTHTSLLQPQTCQNTKTTEWTQPLLSPFPHQSLDAVDPKKETSTYVYSQTDLGHSIGRGFSFPTCWPSCFSEMLIPLNLHDPLPGTQLGHCPDWPAVSWLHTPVFYHWNVTKVFTLIFTPPDNPCVLSQCDTKCCNHGSHLMQLDTATCSHEGPLGRMLSTMCWHPFRTSWRHHRDEKN